MACGRKGLDGWGGLNHLDEYCCAYEFVELLQDHGMVWNAALKRNQLNIILKDILKERGINFLWNVKKSVEGRQNFNLCAENPIPSR